MKKPLRLDRILAWVLMTAGVLALIASFQLTIDAFQHLANPSFVPACNINPIISCGKVMDTPQSRALGFPNTMLGLIGFTAVIVVGMSIFAGASFKSWYWRWFSAGTALAMIMVHWLIFESLFVLQALCPWCMLTWACVAAIFWYTTLHNLEYEHYFKAQTDRPTLEFLKRYHWLPLAAWYLMVATLIVGHFWYYFRTLI